MRRDTNHKGNVAEAAIAAQATKLGIAVSRPICEHTRYDLIFDLRPRLLRVQCKWAPLREDVVVVRLAGYRHTPKGSVRSVYSRDEIDAVAAYCEALDSSYLLPIELVAGRRGIQLRIAPTRNGQRAALHWAAEYELGAVAQLGERHGGTVEVTGSSPVSSIRQLAPRVEPAKTSVGAHDFRARLGWHMQRAAAGEELLVTRRGKPHVRLGPATPPLSVATSAGSPADTLPP